MSTWEPRVPPVLNIRNSRHRKMPLDVDLNDPLPSENQDQVGTSAYAGGSQNGQAGQQPGSLQPPPIDVEALDDDVIISSPRAFAEAKFNSRRATGRTIVVDVDSEERPSRITFNHRSKRRRVSSNQTFTNCDIFINLEGSNNSLRHNVPSVAPPPPPPKEPSFSCPVCMGSLVEEMTTKCGHIFCKACIKAAITAQNKCPTCRRKITMRDIFRVYLPATN